MNDLDRKLVFSKRGFLSTASVLRTVLFIAGFRVLREEAIVLVVCNEGMQCWPNVAICQSMAVDRPLQYSG